MKPKPAKMWGIYDPDGQLVIVEDTEERAAGCLTEAIGYGEGYRCIRVNVTPEE